MITFLKKYFSKKKIIVSLTSFPARINNLQKVFDSIFLQTVPPDKIVLWLAEEEFPEKEKELPQYLLELVNNFKIEIEWCKDLKAHKKYFYALKKYSDCIVITIDDDLIFQNNLIETLLSAHKKFPKAICAKRTHLMRRENNKFSKYNDFVYEQEIVTMKPSMQLLATNGAGTLFPPNLLNFKYFDEKLIQDLALLSDDLWLKTIEVLCDVPVVQVGRVDKLSFVPNSQEQALWKTNVCEFGNDKTLEKIRNWADEKFGANYLLSKIFENQKTVFYFAPHQDDELLSMGVDICSSVQNGDDVHVVLCTDGSKSCIKNVLNNGKSCEKHEGNHIYNLDEEQFIQARDCEFMNSCLALGVLPSNIHVPANRIKDGNLSVQAAEKIVEDFVQPLQNNCTVCTIHFDTGEKQHSDHKNLGKAVYNLFKKRKIKKIKLFKEPYSDCKILKKSKTIVATANVRKKIEKAIKEYSLWQPKEDRYAIGYHSVTNEFNDLKKKMTSYYVSRTR